MLLFNIELILLLALTLSCSSGDAQPLVPQEEVEALREAAHIMGNVYFDFDRISCTLLKFGLVRKPESEFNTTIKCNCSFPDNTCHITLIALKKHNLPGTLPSDLTKLPYLESLDLSDNFLSGTIPTEWGSLTSLRGLGVPANRLSGEIPKELGNLINLKRLDLEANRFSGRIPWQIGNLVDLDTLLLSSNQFVGVLPVELGNLRRLKFWEMSDNNFTGEIPDFFQNWTQLTKLQMIASGLSGPIPSSISALKSLTNLRLSEMSGTIQEFPPLSNLNSLNEITLRNCNITGEIPKYIWAMENLTYLDLSFNKLNGSLVSFHSSTRLAYIFLCSNLLFGDIPQAMLDTGAKVDLSYNSFTYPDPPTTVCKPSPGSNINLYRSFSGERNLKGIIPCAQDLECPHRWHNMFVNSGGKRIKSKWKRKETVYEGEDGFNGGAANLFMSATDGAANWGISTTGDFRDDQDNKNMDYTTNLPSKLEEPIYTTARRSPLSLTYFRYCFKNGSYSVNLHFKEIEFTNDNTSKSLGRRVFDIYIQNKLVQKDFNIAAEAGGNRKPITKTYPAYVTNEILEIRLVWAGKGTTRIIATGTYGPLISAISVDRNLPRGSFTLKQIEAATENFSSANKIGEGGFGVVYKGALPDGTLVAVKQLSAKSSQGNREFLNEISMITCLQHPNLVKLHGCCVEGYQLLLVYEYLENNNLSRALFGMDGCQLNLDWTKRQSICVGIAKGLAFLHEESRLKIVHRDIKGTNILLDSDLNPKISDFGLARLHEEENTHISTKVAGTIGYMAPEYAQWGYLTYKADVYSFGIVALEIVSGKPNTAYHPDSLCTCVLDWACLLYKSNKLLSLVDEKLGSEFNMEEAERMIKIALLCTSASPSLRPTMSEVVTMLEEATTEIPQVVLEEIGFGEDLRFKALKEYHKHLEKCQTSELGSGTTSDKQNSVLTWTDTTASTQDLYSLTASTLDHYRVSSEIRGRSAARTTREEHQPDSHGQSSELHQTNNRDGDLCEIHSESD